MRIRRSNQAPLTLVQVRTQPSVLRLEQGLRSHTGSIKYFGLDVQLILPRILSGAWVFKDTRIPVSTVFENFESGATIDEIMEWFDVSREQIIAVLEFAARSLDSPNPPIPANRQMPVDAHSV